MPSLLTLQRGSWPRLYADALRAVLEQGYSRPSREGETLDVGPSLLSCPAPVYQELAGRGGSAEFARLEQLTYLAGSDPTPLLSVAPRYARFREEDGTWHGAYGPRLTLQLPHVVKELDRHQFSRRAVALIWNPSDVLAVTSNTGPPRDVPCTVALSFWVGPAGELRAQAFMRSTDLWFGLYYDLPAFAFLQRAVAKALRREAGPTYLTTSSLHLYRKDEERARNVHARGTGPLIHGLLPNLEGNLAGFRFRELIRWAQTQLEEATHVSG